MKAHIVTLPGDYIGPEIVAQAVKVLNAVAEKYGHTFCFDERRLGGASIDAFGVPLTDETLAACNAADAVLMGSVGGPKWDAVEPARRPEKGLLALRKGMQVFANLRPCTIHPQLSGACPLRPDIIAKPIDIMILRELTGDIYFGKRWRSEDRAAATDEMAYSVPEVERLARIGFEMAKKRRGRLCSVDKANVLECSRLWRETVERLSREYPEVEVSFMYVDNAAMQLILNPAQFDVMITGNLFGDILSDESAAIAGSLGMMPSASLGSTTRGLYEPIHGSAPDIAGRDIANPLGTILSGALLLRHIGRCDQAIRVEQAVAEVLNELGIPAVVGCGDATDRIQENQNVTVSCAEGDTGYVYAELLDFSVKSSSVGDMPDLPLKVMMNVGNPDRAFDFACLPNEGVGLARLEFIINRMIGVHPRALLEFDDQEPQLQNEIREMMKGFDSPREFYVGRLTEGIATLGAAFYPKRVIVRLSDFKSNEYANLVGGERYEPDEENPMLGFRGAGRYVSDSFRDCFALECEAVKRVRNDMGLTNVEIMIPFVRTVDQAKAVVEELARQGLKRGENGLKIIMMCEIPSNALLAEQFLEYFDGFSIGSNDMTQLALGLDRDSGVVSELFDERNDAVKALLSMAIRAAKKQGKYVGICGQGPSDHEDFAAWLMEEGIDSLSLNPDTVVQTWLSLAELKK